MNFILWLFILVSNSKECTYEKVGVFSDRDSLHIVSNTLDYHFKLVSDSSRAKVLIMSRGHLDSLYSVQWDKKDGLIMFITNIKKRETVVIGNLVQPCRQLLGN